MRTETSLEKSIMLGMGGGSRKRGRPRAHWLDDIKVVVVRPSFRMMTIISSMMMSCLVDPVGAEVANQSNSGLQHSSTLRAWVCLVG